MTTTTRNLFYSDKERDLFISLNKELLGEILQHQIYYYAVSNRHTKANIYGESEHKIFRKPIKFWCLVEYIRPETSYDHDVAERDYNIKIKFLYRYLQEANCEAQEGDFTRFGNVVYEVTSIIGPKLVVGLPWESWDTVANCRSTRLAVTDLRITDEF